MVLVWILKKNKRLVLVSLLLNYPSQGTSRLPQQVWTQLGHNLKVNVADWCLPQRLLCLKKEKILKTTQEMNYGENKKKDKRKFKKTGMLFSALKIRHWSPQSPLQWKIISILDVKHVKHSFLPYCLNCKILYWMWKETFDLWAEKRYI